MLNKILVSGFMSMMIFQGCQAENLKDKAPSKSATKLEKIEGMKGSIINKGYTEIGSFSGRAGGMISVTAYEFHNQKTGKDDYGLSVEISRNNSSKSSFIDMDEISDLIDGISFLEKIKSNPTKSDNFESKYQTNGGFSIVLFNGPISGPKDDLSIAISSGKYSQETAYLSKVAGSISPELTRFKGLILDGQKKIEEMK